jgi:hypothetical protein
MRKRLLKKSYLWPFLIFVLEIAAYAQNKRDDKNYIAGHLQSDLNNESSGIAASSIHPDIFYIHNDSGDKARFFAVRSNGELKGEFHYTTETLGPYGVRDCEDIAVGPGPAKDKSYVYMADIGDNGSSYSFVNIYRIPEPPLPQSPDSVMKLNSATLFVKYPDGAHDAETLMIDPVEKLFYIVTKRHKTVGVYTAPLAFNNKDTVTLTKRCELRFRGLQPFKWIVSGDISKDGSQVVLKSYSKVYYWKREGNEPIWITLQRKPKLPQYEQERLGEAIGFADNGRSYYTVSEGLRQPIYHYAVPKK